MPNEIDRQEQLVADMILDSEGLTDDLEDAAAKRLLAWGLAQAKQLAAEATDDDPDRTVSNLRRVIKRINNLVADREILSDAEFAAEVGELVALTGEKIGLRVQSQSSSQTLLVDRRHLDAERLVETITALLTPHESETTL